MNYIPGKTHQKVISQLHAIGKYIFAALAAGAILCSASCSDPVSYTHLTLPTTPYV